MAKWNASSSLGKEMCSWRSGWHSNTVDFHIRCPHLDPCIEHVCHAETDASVGWVKENPIEALSRFLQQETCLRAVEGLGSVLMLTPAFSRLSRRSGTSPFVLLVSHGVTEGDLLWDRCAVFFPPGTGGLLWPNSWDDMTPIVQSTIAGAGWFANMSAIFNGFWLGMLCEEPFNSYGCFLGGGSRRTWAARTSLGCIVMVTWWPGDRRGKRWPREYGAMANNHVTHSSSIITQTSCI